MKKIALILLATFLALPAFACIGGNETSLEIRGTKVGTLTKYPQGKAIVSLLPAYLPGATHVVTSPHGREFKIKTIASEWFVQDSLIKFGIDSSVLENEQQYFRININLESTRRKVGSFKIDQDELFRIARSRGCGGTLQGF